MEKELTAFVSALRDVLGDRLSSVVLYGSAARGAHVPGKSDVNLMVVLKEADLGVLAGAQKAVRRFKAESDFNPVFWVEGEISPASDVFALEFTDIRENHKVLFGPDPLSGISVDPRHFRFQIEFELRAKLLRLREIWLETRGDRGAMEKFLFKAGSSFFLLFSAAGKLPGAKPVPPESLALCARLKSGAATKDAAEAEALFIQLHRTVADAVQVLNVNGGL